MSSESIESQLREGAAPADEHYLRMRREVIAAGERLDEINVPRTENGNDLGLSRRVEILIARKQVRPPGQTTDVRVEAGTAIPRPMEPGDEVASLRALAVGPAGMTGIVTAVDSRGGYWVVNVNWSNGSRSEGVDYQLLKVIAKSSKADDKPVPAEGWMGTEPPEGSRRQLIRDAVRSLVEKVGHQATPLMIADAIESTLLCATIDGEDDEQTRIAELTRFMKVGEIPVDSGRVLLADPCNFVARRNTDVDAGFLDGAIRKIKGHDGTELGVVVKTPGGDGRFPVIAELVEGKLNGLFIQFGDTPLESGILGTRAIDREEKLSSLDTPDDPRVEGILDLIVNEQGVFMGVESLIEALQGLHDVGIDEFKARQEEKAAANAPESRVEEGPSDGYEEAEDYDDDDLEDSTPDWPVWKIELDRAFNHIRNAFDVFIGNR